MSQLFEFAGNHPVLVGALLALLVVFFMLESRRHGKKIQPSEVGLLTQNDAKLVDLREPKDFNQGHIAGSVNIPFSQLEDHMESLKSHPGPVLFICKMGTTAGSAVVKLEREDAMRLAGGILNWQSQSLPLVHGNKTKSKSKKGN